MTLHTLYTLIRYCEIQPALRQELCRHSLSSLPFWEYTGVVIAQHYHGMDYTPYTRLIEQFRHWLDKPAIRQALWKQALRGKGTPLYHTAQDILRRLNAKLHHTTRGLYFIWVGISKMQLMHYNYRLEYYAFI